MQKGGDIVLNVKSFSKFVKQHFNNNYSNCAKALSVNSSTISRIVRNKYNGGAIFLNKLMNYCVQNDIDYNIFLELPLQKCRTIESTFNETKGA